MEPGNVRISDQPWASSQRNKALASTLGSPAQEWIVRAAARGWVWCTAVIHRGGRGWAGQVHCTPQHQVTHMAHRVQHLKRGEDTGFHKSLERSRKKGQEQAPGRNHQQFLANLQRKLASVDTSLFPKRAYISLDFWQHFSPERLL